MKMIFLTMRRYLRTSYVISFVCAAVLFVIAVHNENLSSFDYQAAVMEVLNQVQLKQYDEYIQISLDEAIKNPFEVDQEDPRLIKKIRQDYLFKPSSEPYNITTSQEDPSIWQAAFVSKLFKQMKNGFFIEVGANDGEFISNSLMLERRYGWEGLLIEADPNNYQQLLSKHRKAYTVPACLSNTKHPKALKFQKLGPRSRLTSMRIETAENYVVQCFPLYSILLAIGRTKIDYFSLDVEGAELDVLESIPWDKVEITVLSVEYDNIKDLKRKLKIYMEDKGYTCVDHPKKANLALDYVFYRKDLLPYQGQNTTTELQISAN